MAKTTASEQSLGVLHKMQQRTFELYLNIIMKGLESDDEDMRLAVASTLNPSILNAVNTFLKNNEITCSPELLNDLTNVAKQVKARGALSLPDLKDLDEMTEMCGRQ